MPSLVRFSHMLRSWTYSLTSTSKINKQDVCYFTFLVCKVRDGLYFLYVFCCYVMTWNASRAEAVPSRAKNQQSIDEGSFYSNTSYGFEYKNATSKQIYDRFNTNIKHWNFLIHSCSNFQVTDHEVLFINRKDNRNC